MTYILKFQEKKILENLIGKEVSILRVCDEEDESGVVSSGSFYHTGILKELEYNSETLKLYSLAIDCKWFNGTRLLKLDFDTKNNFYSCNNTLGVYSNNNYLFEINPIN